MYLQEAKWTPGGSKVHYDRAGWLITLPVHKHPSPGLISFVLSGSGIKSVRLNLSVSDSEQKLHFFPHSLTPLRIKKRPQSSQTLPSSIHRLKENNAHVGLSKNTMENLHHIQKVRVQEN